MERIQNDENKLGLSLQEQPDLLNIHESYQVKGGEFWIAFSQGVGAALYRKLLAFAKNGGVEHIILDTPSIAHAAHRFYEHAGFYQIQTEELPVPYIPIRTGIVSCICWIYNVCTNKFHSNFKNNHIPAIMKPNDSWKVILCNGKRI